MILHAFPLALLLLHPPTSPESDAIQTAPEVEGSSAGVVEDMPDPYAPDWEPPEGPRRPPSSPPPTPGASAELPPSSVSNSTSSEAAAHGKRLQVAGLVIGGGGAIGLLVGVYFYDDLNKTRSALAAEQNVVASGGGSPERVDELQDDLHRKRRAMIISLAAGGSAIGLGSVLFVVGGVVKQRTASKVITHLAPGPGLVGLSFRRSF